MTTENKKIAYYALGALALGGVAFFVSSFFKKEEIKIPNYGQNEANTNISSEIIDEKEKTTTTDYKGVFSDLGEKASELSLFSFLKKK